MTISVRRAAASGSVGLCVASVIWISASSAATESQEAQVRPSSGSRTKVVMLGTGNPNPDPDRSGPATVVLVDDVPYLIDCGAGVVRRWAAAIRANKLSASVWNLKTVFITHLHTDHTLGYADLIFTPWTIAPQNVPGSRRPLEVYGPAGVGEMTNHLIAAYSADVRVRTSEGGSRQLGGRSGPVVNAHEIKEGVVHKDERVSVTAFLVPHGNWPQAFGFRFNTPDKTIVISGDTAFTPVIAEQCNGCDILVHEGGLANDESAYFRASHTRAEDLGKVAVGAKPKLLILYHQRNANEDGLRIIRSQWSGRVVVANDLQVFE